MFIFSGKLDWYSYAVNENITIVVPAGFALNDPIYAYWQWTVDSGGNHKANTSQSGTIQAVTSTANKSQISFSFGYYSFDAIVASDYSTLVATMRNPKGDTSQPLTLIRQPGESDQSPSTVTYTGKLNWFNYAVNEMIVLVIQAAGVSNGAPVGLYHQWTVHSDGTQKKNCPVNATFRNVTVQSDGIKGTFGDGYYTYEVTVPNNGQDATIRMSNPNGNTTSSSLKQAH
ncbi:hypothetical protein BKA70DRAFT_315572 [Coprinopsis sp. MPI-PUGE-AT-0042]|nr:hypothetical protein BKA70DRAFT_315572 [Coprinopsis sp. MPI-PUGE-AT-0042]